MLEIRTCSNYLGRGEEILFNQTDLLKSSAKSLFIQKTAFGRPMLEIAPCG